MTEIDIVDLKKRHVLAALYNNARPSGRGVQHPQLHQEMTMDEARYMWRTHGEVVDQSRRGLRRIKHIRFDYVHGRLLKVTFRGASVDVTSFDREYGPGAASRVVDHLRRTGSVASIEG